MKIGKLTTFLGGIRPVAQRELREGARRPINHWLRVGSAAAGTIMLCAIVADYGRPAAELGSWLFAGLHSLLLGLICLIVPGLAADSIAREKREGTLGLLFLTPLTAGGIVAGKGLALAIRVLTLWLAVLPVLTIPFLTGGVRWFDALTAMDLEFCAAVLCLGGGLLASSITQERNAAFALALLFGVAFVLLFGWLFVFWLLLQFGGLAVFAQLDWRMCVEESAMLFTGVSSRQFGGWAMLNTPTALGRGFKSLLLASPPVALLFFYVIVRFAAHRIARSWQDRVPSLRRERWIKRISAPLFRGWFARGMRRTLDHNPIAWLQQYSWKARLAKWGLCLAIVLLEGVFPHREWYEIQNTQGILLWMLAGVATFVGVNSFMQEKRSGALELILITPLSVNTIIIGRVQGLWKQFLPSVLVIGICFFISGMLSHGWGNSSWTDFLYISIVVTGSFLALPVFTTYFALRVKNLFAAALLTWVAMFIAPAFGGLAMDNQNASDLGICFGIFCGDLGFALLACFLLRHSLSRRIYSF